MKKLSKKKKDIIIITLVIMILMLIPILFYLLFPKFVLKNFQEKNELNFQSTFVKDNFEVCYGNVFKCEKASIELENSFDTTKLGTYKVVYKITYQNKIKEVKQTIEVKDKIAPEVFIKDESIKVCPNGNISKIDILATDNYDGDITDKIEVELNNNKVIYKVTDSSGNTTKKEINAIIEDKESPVITLKGDQTIYLSLNQKYEELGFIATDNCAEDLTDQVNIEGAVNTSVPGEYKLTYRVKDESENETSVTRNIYVYQNKNFETPTGKSIYLTFDDGPGPNTNRLLDILKKYNVKATFFVTNQGITKGHDSDIKRANEEGHTIGLHTYSHNYKTIYASEEAYFNDLYNIQKKVKDITGHESKIIRFPGGSSNTISKGNKGIMSRLTKSVEARGFRYFDWNVYGGDAGETNNPTKIASNIIKSLGNGQTYMVLQHDIKGYSVDAVETVIQFGLSHGYTFRPITMDTPNVHHRVNN